MILLLTIGTAILQTRPTAYYDYENKVYSPRNNVNLKNVNCETFLFLFQEKGIIVEYYTVQCYAKGYFIWIIILVSYNGILKVIIVILAIQIRNVTIKPVNDSKNVIDIVFIVSMTFIFSLISLFFFGDYVSIASSFTAIAILFGVTGVIILTFVPKVGKYLILSLI